MNQIEILFVKKRFDNTEYLESLFKQLNIIHHTASYEEETLDIYNKENIDLVIVNIPLPYWYGESHGIKVARSISKLPGRQCPFLYYGDSKDATVFYKEIKDLLPSIFLGLPRDHFDFKNHLLAAINEFIDAKSQIALGRDHGIAILNGDLYFNQKQSLLKTKKSVIIYAQIEGRYCKLITDHGSFLYPLPLKEMLAFLSQLSFVETHRNYAVNLNRIKEVLVEDHLIIMDNDDEVYIGRRQKQSFLEQYQLHSI